MNTFSSSHHRNNNNKVVAESILYRPQILGKFDAEDAVVVAVVAVALKVTLKIPLQQEISLA